VSTPRFLDLPKCARPASISTPRGTFAAHIAQPPKRTALRGVALLVPGFTGSKEDFIGILEPLANRGYRTVALDPRGHYETPGPPDEASYAIEELGADLVELIVAIAPTDGPSRQVHVVGHSLGGVMARYAAQDRPDLFRSLTLLCSGPRALSGPPADRVALQLGALGMRRKYAEHFDNNVFYGGLTYNSHPLSCAAAIAAIRVLEEDDLVGNAKRLDPVMRGHHEELMANHSSVGRVRNIGLFGIVELVKSRDTMEPLSPYNVVNETMQAVNKGLLERGLFTMIRFNGIMTNPPLCITEEQLDDGFAIIDEVLGIADAAAG